jgi:hypothetical protein
LKRTELINEVQIADSKPFSSVGPDTLHMLFSHDAGSGDIAALSIHLLQQASAVRHLTSSAASAGVFSVCYSRQRAPGYVSRRSLTLII